MCIYWSDTLKQVGIFYATWPEHFLKHIVSKPLLFLSLGSTLLLSCEKAGIMGTRCVRVTKTTPRINGLLGELPGLRKSSYLWLGFITAKAHKAKSGKGKAHGAESWGNQTQASKCVSPSGVRKNVLSSSSNELWRHMWNVFKMEAFCQGSLLKTQCLYEVSVIVTQKQRGEWWLPGAEGKGNGELLFNGCKVSKVQDE